MRWEHHSSTSYRLDMHDLGNVLIHHQVGVQTHDEMVCNQNCLEEWDMRGSIV